MSSKINLGRWAPFAVAASSFFLYWAALPPSWIGWAIFLVPAVWAATVFNPDFAAARQNRENRRKGEKESAFDERGNGENRRFDEFASTLTERLSADVAKFERTERTSEGARFGKKERFRRTRRFGRFVGRVFFGGEYRQYWSAAFLFWAATVVWISYPHPATTLGWLAASAYLALHFPLFVAITRALVGFRTKRDDATRQISEVKKNGETGCLGEIRQIGETARSATVCGNGGNAKNGKLPPTLTLRVREKAQVAQNTQVDEKARKRRAATRRGGLPLWLAAPIAWTAVEWARNRGLGGFSFAGLSHSLYDFPQFIQIAEPLGEYGVGAAIVAIGTLLGTAVSKAVSIKSGNYVNEAVSENGAKRRKFAGAKFAGAKFAGVAIPFFGAIAIFTVVVGFGVWRLEFFDAAERSALASGAVPCRVALLQDGTTYRFPVPDWQNRQVAETYLALAAEAGRDPRGFDVAVWPESCFDVFWDENTTEKREKSATGEKSADSATGETGEESADSAAVERIARAEKSRALSRSRRDAARLTERLGAAAILGTTVILVDVDAGDETTVLNAAVFAPRFDSASDATLTAEKTLNPGSWASWGTPVASGPTDPDPSAFRLYGKRRLVIFGEYVPGADWLPDWFPLKAVCADFSLARGVGPVVFPVARRGVSAENGGNGRNEPLLFAPHICFESSIPHYVKEQVRELAAVGAEPDVLVCLSNDGWFRNGSQTDGHLATQVFRAVENRKPLVAATHGGFSAHVDQAGRIRSRGARGGTEVVAAEVLPVDCERFGRAALGGRDLAETLALGCVVLSLGALVATAFRRFCPY